MSNSVPVSQTLARESAAETSPYAVLRIRDFRLYLTGRFIASFGQQMLTVAVGWELYERTNSALHLGLVGLTQMIPMLLCTLPAGHAADNFNRKAIILMMILVGAVSAWRSVLWTLEVIARGTDRAGSARGWSDLSGTDAGSSLASAGEPSGAPREVSTLS